MIHLRYLCAGMILGLGACTKSPPKATPLEGPKPPASAAPAPRKPAAPAPSQTLPSAPPNAKVAAHPPPWEAWRPEQSRSIGNVLEGRLEGGVQMPKRAPGIVHNPKKDRNRAYGTVEVVRAMIRAGKALAHRPPEEHLLINDLSYAHGGPISGHASHRAGRDVDFYFPLRTQGGEAFPSKLIPLNPMGIGHDYRNLEDPNDDIPVRIDLERSWDYLAALLQDPQAPVQVIYLVAHLQRALAEHARKRGADPQLIRRFLTHSCQPRGAPHDDHGHIRFYCSAQDIAYGCEDNSPIDPQQRARLRAAGVKAVIARPAPRSSRKVKTTSAKQARKRAGKLHPSVQAFLDARKSWTRNIPPGAARCR